MLPPNTTLTAAVDDWLAEISGCRPSTLEGARQQARYWIRRWGAEKPVRDIGEEEVRRYLVELRQTHAGSTCNLARRYLTWFFGHLRRRGAVADNAATSAPRFTEEVREPRTLSDEEVARLLAAARGPFRTFLVLALESGLRRASLLALQWGHVDLVTGWMHVPAGCMKGRHEYHAPLSDRALGALRGLAYVGPGRVFPRSRGWVQREMSRTRARARVICTCHDARRTFFTAARRRGVPLEVAMRLSDHHDVQTALRHYRAISADELLRAVGRGGSNREESVG